MTLAVNGRKIQIPILHGVKVNKISVFLDLLTVIPSIIYKLDKLSQIRYESIPFAFLYIRAGSRSKLICHLLRHHSVVYKNTFRASLIKKFLSFNLANLAKSSLNCQKHEISKTSKTLKRKKFFDQTGSKCVLIHY